MNTRCPSCETQLLFRPLGLINLRCPACSTWLATNHHPMESFNRGLIEPTLYAGAAILLLLAVVLEMSVSQALVFLAIALGVAIAIACYLWWTDVPAEWRRYVKISRPPA